MKLLKHSYIVFLCLTLHTACTLAPGMRYPVADAIPAVYAVSDITLPNYLSLLQQSIFVNNYLQADTVDRYEIEDKYFICYKVRQYGDTVRLSRDGTLISEFITNHQDLMSPGSEWKVKTISVEIDYSYHNADVPISMTIKNASDGTFNISSGNEKLYTHGERTLRLDTLSLSAKYSREVFDADTINNFFIQGTGAITEYDDAHEGAIEVQFRIPNSGLNYSVEELQAENAKYCFHCSSQNVQTYTKFYSGDLFLNVNDVYGYNGVSREITVCYHDYFSNNMTIEYMGESDVLDVNELDCRYY